MNISRLNHLASILDGASQDSSAALNTGRDAHLDWIAKMCRDPNFNEQGLVYDYGRITVFSAYDRVLLLEEEGVTTGCDAINKFFGLNISQSHYLFSPYSFPQFPRPESYAGRIAVLQEQQLLAA
jgi:hypothetical protein